MTIWPLPRIDILPFEEIEENRDVALVVSQEAYQAVKGRLRFTNSAKVVTGQATETHWQSLAEDVVGDVIYSVGGGVAVDAAKYIGKVKGLPVVSMPTAMTVDAFFTWAAGVREDGCVKYVETGPPEKVIIDLDVLAEAPRSLRAAGICDLLSIATGSWDWRFARDEGQLDEATHYEAWADGTAASILGAAIDCAEAAGRGDRAGLKQLVDCLALEVQLCNQLGHSRPEEGSEHYFAYSAEHHVDEHLPHGDLVGPGILIAAQLQQQDIRPLKRALVDCCVPFDRIPPDRVRYTLEHLGSYVRLHGLPFGVAHAIESVPSDIGSVLT